MHSRSERRPGPMWRRYGGEDSAGALEPDSSAAPSSAARWPHPTTTVRPITTMAHPITRRALMAPGIIGRRATAATPPIAPAATDPTIPRPARSSAMTACAIPARNRADVEHQGPPSGGPFYYSAGASAIVGSMPGSKDYQLLLRDADRRQLLQNHYL